MRMFKDNSLRAGNSFHIKNHFSVHVTQLINPSFLKHLLHCARITMTLPLTFLATPSVSSALTYSLPMHVLHNLT